MIEQKNLKAVIFLLVMVVVAAPAFADSCCPNCAAKTKTTKASNIKTSKLMADQYNTLMQTKIFLDGPSAILARTKALNLTAEQSRKLLEIERQARLKALAVLTPAQQKKLGNVPVTPITMASVCKKVCGTITVDAPANKQKQTAQQTVCPVMGGKINKSVFATYKGKKVYFCCAGCETPFLKNPEKYLSKLPQFQN
ncbi:MAG: YHS domain-containing protein [Planctomycetota bacterium]|jgi:YHS domain-containing protein